MNENEVVFRNGDGTELVGTLTRPEHAGRTPAVLLCQGLSGVRTLVLPEVARALAAAGIASLRFDYAGFGGSGGARGWIDPPARSRDAGAALEALCGMESVDPVRVGVYGHSYGGPVAIAVAAQHRRVRALAVVSGPGSGRELLRAGRTSWEWLAFQARLEAERAALASGSDPTVVEVGEILPFSPAFAAAYAALKASQGGTSALGPGEGLGQREFYLASADRMLQSRPDLDARALGRCPTLLVNGLLDDVAPVEDVEPVYAALPGDKQWILVPGADHNALDSDPGLAEALGHVTEWFARHL